MRFACIIRNCLYSLVESDGQSTFEMLFEQFQNLEWLVKRFEDAEANGELNFYQISVQQAILKATEEARDLHDQILDCFDFGDNPDALFVPFHNGEADIEPYVFQLRKAKPEFDHPFIRIYAVKIEDAYVVVGGDIKTTKDTEGHKITDRIAENAKYYRNAIEGLRIKNSALMNRYIKENKVT